MVVKGKMTVEFEGESTNNKCSTVSQLTSNTDHQVLGLVVGEELLTEHLPCAVYMHPSK